MNGNPVISDIVVQLNCEVYAAYLALARRQKIQTKPVEPELITLRNMCMPSMNLEECNDTALYRVLRDLGYTGESYKKARTGKQVRIIQLLNPYSSVGLLKK